MSRWSAAAVGAVLAIAVPAATAAPSDDWRRVATDADRARIREWRATWLTALVAAQATDPAAVAADRQLFDPDHALADAVPPAGSYRCRSFKLGAKGTAARGFTPHPWFECRVADRNGPAGFARTSGPQRPVGRIYRDGASRGVFLGTLALGDESRALPYGRDASRDMVGLVERIGPRRWRIAFPQPRFESQLEVMELAPAEQ